MNDNLKAGIGIGVGIACGFLMVKLLPVVIAGAVLYGVSKIVLASGKENKGNGANVDQ